MGVYDLPSFDELFPTCAVDCVICLKPILIQGPTTAKDCICDECRTRLMKVLYGEIKGDNQ